MYLHIFLTSVLHACERSALGPSRVTRATAPHYRFRADCSHAQCQRAQLASDVAATAGSSIKFDFSVRTLEQLVLLVFHFIEWISKYVAWRVRLCSVYKAKFPRFLHPLIGEDLYMNSIHKFSLCCRRHSNEALLPCDYLCNMSSETLSSLQCVMEQRLFQPQAGTKIIYQM